MFDILVMIAFIWLFVKVFGLAFRLTWSLAKIVAVILFTLAIPVMILCLLFASGVVMLIPVALVLIALAILKAC